MIKIETVMWLLPVAFMIHDFEEIIFMKAWFSRKEKDLIRRFPRISKRIIPHMKKLSSESFSLCVAEEFILLCFAVSIMTQNGYFSAFAGLLAAFFIHLCVHFVQAAVFRGYIPALFTSLITAVYCLWAFAVLSGPGIVIWYDAALWCAFFIVINAGNLLAMHLLAGKFESFLNAWSKGK